MGTRIDNSIRSIKRSYDGMKHIPNVTSYATADATGGASSDVQYACDSTNSAGVFMKRCRW